MSQTGRPPWSWMDDAFPYALDALDRQQRHAVDRWLVTTGPEREADFQIVVGRIQETMAELTVFDSVPPPAHLESALLRALDQHDPRTHSLARRDALGKRWHMRRWSAAAVVAVGAGLAVAPMLERVDGDAVVTAQQVLDRPDSRQASVAVTGGGAMTVARSKELGAAAVSFSELPALPLDRAYQLWLSTPGGTSKSVAVTGDPTSVVTAVDTGDTLAVTVEPADGSPAPTTLPIVRMTVD